MVVKAKILRRVVGPSKGLVPSSAEVMGGLPELFPTTKATTNVPKTRTVGGTELAQPFIMTFLMTSSYCN